MWQNKILRQFQTVPPNPVDSDFLGPYNRLLYTLFPPDYDYTVVPRYLPASQLAGDWIMAFEVLFVNKPVFILELKRPADLKFTSARELAHNQLKERMRDLYSRCPIPTLHGLSAMGTALCFYSVETRTQNARIMPLDIPHDPEVITDCAPKERWNLDVLTVEGKNKLLAVIEEIKQACGALETLSLRAL